MKKILIIAYLLIAYCSSQAQTQYEVSQDEKHPEVKVLRGIISKDIVKNDTSFKWYASNQSYFKADTAVVNAFAKAKDKVQFVLFGGTWCDDTQYILPKFFKIQEQSGIADDKITFFGVNRAKKSLGSIAEAFGITNVPTIIIMSNGKEIGRVVEYGKTGKWDKDLADILNTL